MNSNLTEIAFVLDRSGSMAPIAQAAIDGFNEFLHDQLQTPGSARLSLVLFDHEIDVPCLSLPLPEIAPLDERTYVTRGSTALLDAVGLTIAELGRRLAAIPEADRPGQVIVAIFTDGEENSSRRFTWHQVADMIRHQQDVYSWQFLFLGANQDAIASAARLSIQRDHAATYVADAVGKRSSSKSISKAVTLRRMKSIDPEFTDESLDAPLQSLVDEEDRKGREN